MNNQRTSSGLIKPERLRLGDIVGIIAPSSPSPRPEALARCAEALAQMGFQPKLARHAGKRLGFLAGTDAERAADIMAMFTDPGVKAIQCLRGGYGTSRLLSLLDYDVIRQHPKILAGYSDLTAIHCVLSARAGLVSFHAPMLDSALASPDLPAFTRQSFLKTVMEAVPAGPLSAGCETKTAVTIRGGKATGELIGGNLSVLVTTLGTPYQPSFAGKILFLEDVDEAPYRYDRMLTHLENSGALAQVAGVAVGVNHRCHDPKAAGAAEYRQTLEDVLTERLSRLTVPVVRDLPFGHVPLNATLPVGVQALLDGDKGELVITEAAVW